MSKKLNIKIEFSSDSLFGYVDPDNEGVDIQSSIKSFSEALDNYLVWVYGQGTRVETVHGSHDRVSVNGEYDHDECPWIDDYIGKVWNDNDWIEYL